MRPITKQLKRVTERPAPAPARMRPAGRKAKSAIAVGERLGPARAAASGSAAATRLGDPRPGIGERAVHAGPRPPS